MKAALLLAVLAAGAFASDPVPISKVASKKTSPARRVYDLILTNGSPANMIPSELDWRGRKVREMQAPNDITTQGFATADAGAPECLIRLTGRGGKIAEAVKMGLPVPILIKDRRCTGLKKDVELTFYGETKEVDPRDPKGKTIGFFQKRMSAYPGTMTQPQLDILFGLIEDCLKNGV